MTSLEISVHDLDHLLKSKSDRLKVIDIRELEEVRLAPFPNAIHIPMGDVLARLDDLMVADDLVILCHHGIRSMRITHVLQQNGIENVKSLKGGIDAWSRVIDPSVPCY